MAVGIVTSLTAILLPALTVARSAARLSVCQNNIRQLGLGLLDYASANQGYFPPNTPIPSPGIYWYSNDCVGQFLAAYGSSSSSPGGSYLACPNDNNGLRSYAMNAWASAALPSSDFSVMPAHGALWGNTPLHASRLILVVEALSTTGGSSGYYAPAAVGFYGGTGDTRFGVYGGFSPLVTAGRWGQVNCELDFSRHTSKQGEINICFADGHVATESPGQLVSSRGSLSGEAYWSALDVP